MTKSIFVTGTDTGVGKTAITCALLAAAGELGLSTSAIKPVAAGCDAAGYNEDALQLMASMSDSLAYQEVNPVALRAAVAPHIAAQYEGQIISTAQLLRACRSVISRGTDLVLIEGAGGWRVPISPRETLADLAVQLRAEVIIVVAMQLGCINHALLTAEAVQRDGLTLAGWVANEPRERMTCHRQNLETLQRLLPAPLLGEVPHMAVFDAASAARCLDVKRLLGL